MMYPINDPGQLLVIEQDRAHSRALSQTDAPRLDLAKLDRMELAVAGLRGQRQAAAETVAQEKVRQRDLGADLARKFLAPDGKDQGRPELWLRHSDEVLAALYVRREDIQRLVQDHQRLAALEARIAELDREIQAHTGAVSACRKFVDDQTAARFF